MGLKVSKKSSQANIFKDKGVCFKSFKFFCQKFGSIDIYPPFLIHVVTTWLTRGCTKSIETKKKLKNC